MKRTFSPKAGFTLVELLVVIAIIGILIALLLPAVQAAREAARRSQCVNNMKQIALALHNYHDVNKTFPPRGIWGTEIAGLTTFPHYHHTWITAILPYMEQTALYDKADLMSPAWQQDFTNDPVPSLRCPSDSGFQTPDETRDLTITNYVGCEGLDWNPGNAYGSVGGHVIDAEVFTVFGHTPILPTGARPHATRMADISDGTTNTILIAETIATSFVGPSLDMMGDGVPSTRNRCYFSAAFVDLTTSGSASAAPWTKADGSGTGSWIFGSVWDGPPWSQPRGRGPTFMIRGGVNSHLLGCNSYHPGICNVALADGSVRNVSETLDWVTWTYLCARASRKPVGEW